MAGLIKRAPAGEIAATQQFDDLMSSVGRPFQNSAAIQIDNTTLSFLPRQIEPI